MAKPHDEDQASKVVLELLEAVSLSDVRTLIATCEHGTFSGERERAVFLFLLDTGVRARDVSVFSCLTAPPARRLAGLLCSSIGPLPKPG